MKTFVAINNVEHFADQLTSEVDGAKRATLMRLLVEEEDKLGAGLEQLGIAELRIAKGRQLIARQMALVAKIAGDGHDGREANDLLAMLKEVQALFEAYRRSIMSRLNEGIL